MPEPGLPIGSPFGDVPIPMVTALLDVFVGTPLDVFVDAPLGVFEDAPLVVVEDVALGAIAIGSPFKGTGIPILLVVFEGLPPGVIEDAALGVVENVALGVVEDVAPGVIESVAAGAIPAVLEPATVGAPGAAPTWLPVGEVVEVAGGRNRPILIGLLNAPVCWVVMGAPVPGAGVLTAEERPAMPPLVPPPLAPPRWQRAGTGAHQTSAALRTMSFLKTMFHSSLGEDSPEHSKNAPCSSQVSMNDRQARQQALRILDQIAGASTQW